jgi:Bacterial regulatory helix-turn-helix protein, lysR family
VRARGLGRDSNLLRMAFRMLAVSSHGISSPFQSERIDALSGLSEFIAVADHASFRAAAAELQVTPGAVSQAIRALVERVGMALFQRTTRSVALTEAVGSTDQRPSCLSAPTGANRRAWPAMKYSSST